MNNRFHTGVIISGDSAGGVRAFKEKFDPDWQPRYLAVAGQGLPVLSLIDVTLLIGGGLKGLMRK